MGPAVGLDHDEVAELRATLTADEAHQLLTFARRQATIALREGSLDRARHAIAALVLVDRDVVDPRAVRLGIGLPLYALRELGGDVTAAVDEAIARSETGIAAAFAARRAIAPTMSLEDCGYVQVRTAHGLGLVADPIPRGETAADLAETAVAMADHLDANGEYRTGPIEVTMLPATWFRPRPAADDLAAADCVRLSATRPVGEDPLAGDHLLLFLADTQRRRIATQLAEAAARASTAARPRATLTEGRLLLLVIGHRSSGHVAHEEDAAETTESLGRFGELLRPLLGDLRPGLGGSGISGRGRR